MKRATVEQRRIEILETTCQVVVERGFAATRVSDVASRLGVSTGLIHYHFDSKEMLLAEALRYAAEQDIARLEQELEQAHTALTKLDTMFTFDMPEVGEPSWMLWIDGWGEALRNPTMRRISQHLDVAWKDRLVSIIVAGVERRRVHLSGPAGRGVAAGRPPRRAGRPVHRPRGRAVARPAPRLRPRRGRDGAGHRRVRLQAPPSPQGPRPRLSFRRRPAPALTVLVSEAHLPGAIG